MQPWLSYLATAAFLTYLISLQIANPGNAFSKGMASYATTMISPVNPSVLQLNMESAKSCWGWSSCLSNLCSLRQSYPSGYLAIQFSASDPACAHAKSIVLSLPGLLGIITAALSLLSLIVIGSRMVYVKWCLVNSEVDTWRLRAWRWSFSIVWIFSRLFLLATVATVSIKSTQPWTLATIGLWSVYLLVETVVSGRKFVKNFDLVLDEDVSHNYNSHLYRQLPSDN